METTISPSVIQTESPSAGFAGIPVYIYATVFSSFCVITGLIWDICWHLSIGRDGLLSPPHLVIYLGAVVAGLFSGYEILRKTFWGNTIEKAQSVKIWGFFYSSLGSLFCVWGALSMLTSAPFDDWWHNAYGLDVTILSPPHTVLILGIIGIQFGAMICVIAVKNQLKHLTTIPEALRKSTNSKLFLLFALSAGFLLTIWYTLLSEGLSRLKTHQTSYYMILSFAFPFFLLAAGRAFKHRWTITAIAAVYTLLMLGTLWVIPLFPAEPKLGPILNHFDHYQGFHFPILFVVPAIILDLLRNRFAHFGDWKLSALLGTAFLLVIFVTQWYFGGFLAESPLARNWFFGSHYWYFGSNPDWEFRYKFAPWMEDSAIDLIKGLAMAWLAAIFSARVGMLWGIWMQKIQR
jgi:hypothetical protein